MIVPVLQTLFLTVIVLSIERAFAITKAKGKGNVTKFVKNVKEGSRQERYPLKPANFA